MKTAKEKAIKDYENVKQEAYEKAKNEGRIAEKLENARGMNANGISSDIIHRVTGLSIEEIEQL